tara:strand:- start:550 stop:738 length:189 start_codon:yes stop_codon:yes gene_type:complete
MTRTARTEKRNKDIAKKFLKLSNKKYKGRVKLYTTDTILAMLSEEFYLSERTIEDIIFSSKS